MVERHARGCTKAAVLDSLKEEGASRRTSSVRKISRVQALAVILRDMRTSKRRRDRRRTVVSPPAGVELAEIAARASYVGSSEHKSYPSRLSHFGGCSGLLR